MEIINQSERANEVMSQQKMLLQDGKQKQLPFRQERILTKIFTTMLNSNYDATGLNKQWLSTLSVDERSLIKKFLRESSPQFSTLTDYWMEEFCQRLKAKTVAPGTVLKKSNKESEKLFILLRGQVTVHTPKFNSEDQIELNEYLPGQSFGDPLLNETASVAATVSVTSSQSARVFFLSKRAYLHMFIDKLNELNSQRLRLVRDNFSPFNMWDETRLKNLLVMAKERVLNVDECLVREEQA